MKINKPSTINHRLSANFGFTLVELLVVISIIGILATIVIASYTGAQAKARDTQRINDLDDIKYALILYKQDNGSFPDNPGSSLCNFPTNSDCLSQLVSGKYVSSLPSAPNNSDNYGYYNYSQTAGGGFGEYGVLLTAKLENYSGTGLSGSFRKANGPSGACSTGTNSWYCLNFK